jgi:hypothetical protein
MESVHALSRHPPNTLESLSTRFLQHGALVQQDLLPQKDLVECAENAMIAVPTVCRKHAVTNTEIISIIWNQFSSCSVLNIIFGLSTEEV